MIITNLHAIQTGRLGPPSEPVWRKLMGRLGKTGADDEPLPVSAVLDSNGLADALWVLATLGHDRVLRLWACACAERALPVWERARPDDGRPRWAIETARRFANGEATEAELNAAWDAARDAARDARAAARDAARDAAWDAARAAAWAAAWAARDAAWDAARDAAWAAAWAARDAAWDAARDAARDAADDADDAEREWQSERLRAYLRGEAA